MAAPGHQNLRLSSGSDAHRIWGVVPDRLSGWLCPHHSDLVAAEVKLGLIARADNSGLGIQSWEFYRHMHPDRVLVIDVGHLHDNTGHCNKRTFLSRYPGALVSRGWTPTPTLLEKFCQELDVIFTAETTYSSELTGIAHRAGAKVVVQYNFEFLGHQLYQHPHPDVFAAPSQWNWNAIDVPNRVHLPVPIATDRFIPAEPHNGRLRVLHVVGRPATYDRNGTPDLLAALPHITADIQLTLTCQDVNYLNQLLHTHPFPPNVDVVVNAVDVDHYWDLYAGHDIMVLPRRFGGLCLPAQEAIGAGMPVIMPDIDPNNGWMPDEWLVPAEKRDQFQSVTPIDVFYSDPEAIAELIDLFANDQDFRARGRTQAAQLRHELSWQTLRPSYDAVLKDDADRNSRAHCPR